MKPTARDTGNVSEGAPERQLQDFLTPDSTDEPVHEMQRQVDRLFQGPPGTGLGSAGGRSPRAESRDLKDIFAAEEDDLLLSEGVMMQGPARPQRRAEDRLSRWNPLGYGLLSYFMARAPASEASPPLVDEPGDLGASDLEASSGR